MIYYKKNNFDDILQKNNFKNISMFCLFHDMIYNLLFKSIFVFLILEIVLKTNKFRIFI
jgi:hypothetical protein